MAIQEKEKNLSGLTLLSSEVCSELYVKESCAHCLFTTIHNANIYETNKHITYLKYANHQFGILLFRTCLTVAT